MSMKLLEKRLKALADRTRLKLLFLLGERECCVCELTESIGFSQATISRHLQRLVEAGFITFKRRGSFQIYSLAPEDQEAQRLLNGILEVLRKDNALVPLRKKLKLVDKKYIWQGNSNELE